MQSESNKMEILPNYMSRIKAIKTRFMHGELDYDQAKMLAQPIIDEMNIKGRAIAKEFKRTYYPIKFTSVFR